MEDEIRSEAELLAHLPEGIDPAGRELIARAYRTAAECHQGQTRDEGTPYLRHPVGVFQMLLEDFAIRDPEILAAALLHDVVEDSPLTVADLETRFTPRVARMVGTLTKDKRPGPGKEERERAYLEGVRHADLPTRMIKIADRLDNTGRLDLSPSAEKRAKYWRETREQFLPLAQATHEEMYRRLAKWVDWFAEAHPEVRGA